MLRSRVTSMESTELIVLHRETLEPVKSWLE